MSVYARPAVGDVARSSSLASVHIMIMVTLTSIFVKQAKVITVYYRPLHATEIPSFSEKGCSPIVNKQSNRGNNVAPSVAYRQLCMFNQD
jgi:hypothetical protein